MSARVADCETCGARFVQEGAGRRRRFCSTTCRVRAHRAREAAAVYASMPVDVPIVIPPAPTPDDQVARALLEAQVIGYTFGRLGVEARPSLAWRCARLSAAILAALADTFPNITPPSKEP